VLALAAAGLTGVGVVHAIHWVNDQGDDAEQERTTLTHRTSALRAQATGWRAAEGTLRRALDGAIEKIELLEAQVQTEALQRDKARQEASTTQGVNLLLAAQVRELAGEVESLHGAIAALQYENDELRGEGASLSATVQALSARVSVLGAALAGESRAHLEAAQALAMETARADALELQIAGMRAKEAQRSPQVATPAAIITQPCASPASPITSGSTRSRLGDSVGPYPDYPR